MRKLLRKCLNRLKNGLGSLNQKRQKSKVQVVTVDAAKLVRMSKEATTVEAHIKIDESSRSST